MSFYSSLCEALKGKIPESAMQKLPKSYFIVGKIAIIKLHGELEKYKKEIGEAILKILPVKTVCLLKEIRGERRNPCIEVLCGNGTETVYKEHGCFYKLDVAKVMFSKGNKFEKMRVVKQVKPGEIVIDMFAGIGYFTIPIAKHTKVRKIYAIDINPDAVFYLKENVKINKVEEKVEILEGDCREICKILGEKIKGDRILMGYIFETYRYLESALNLAKSRTVIHYHFLAKKEEIEEEMKTMRKKVEKKGFKANIKYLKKIKSYAPRVYHWVADIEIV